ncbi:formylglycine-generating enzyme family protein [Stratiformator vulcanicus]|uniref:Serine/threonine-protein kinase pkn1 n=1 Tax=Stratiformator vulcanicus TaxID=2527980 RepID=A0A517R009_9PLAN|nr:formylglycine-generating enzyme family protein [Stratiformator vulcanicus]QDT37221.1 Serine/threonine-protein kinase pkn1 [Stratiformator vulcanicus]
MVKHSTLFCGIAIFTVVLVCRPAAAQVRPGSVSENTVGMEMVAIPPGEFGMGESDQSGLERDHPWSVTIPGNTTNNERPQHRVRISKPFDVAKHEVTVGQFKQFVDATGHVTDAEKNDGALGFDPTGEKHTERLRVDKKFSWKNPGFEQDDQHPVVCVSWHDANAYCKWLSEKEGKTYRLPTEAEWEYCARAGTKTWYSWGNDPDLAYEHGNVGDATLEKAHPQTVSYQRTASLQGDGDGHLYTAPVGSMKPNPAGLLDMHGNVWEWCSDKFQLAYYQELVKPLSRKEKTTHVFEDPTGPKTTPQHEHGDWRSIRGGSWYTAPYMTRSAARGFANAPDAFCYVGFRVIKER